MKEWKGAGIHQVSALLTQDPDFQNLMLQLENARTSYHEATAMLSAQCREQIENYIALCEEVEYQRTVTAYYCGKRNG